MIAIATIDKATDHLLSVQLRDNPQVEPTTNPPRFIGVRRLSQGLNDWFDSRESPNRLVSRTAPRSSGPAQSNRGKNRNPAAKSRSGKPWAVS